MRFIEYNHPKIPLKVQFVSFAYESQDKEIMDLIDRTISFLSGKTELILEQAVDRLDKLLKTFEGDVKNG